VAMPKLLIFVACQKAILDTEGLVSLIQIIEGIEISVPKDLPPRTAVPARLETISVWNLEEGETGLYEQKIEAVEDGVVAMHTEPRTLESSPGRLGAKIISAITAVPVTEGRLEFRLSYRRIGDPQWTLVANYPVRMTVVRQ
jgi:hypothetical protein